MDSTYFLEIVHGKYAIQTDRQAFDSMSKALGQLELLKPKLGRRERYNDESDNTHTIVSDCGQMTVVCSDVISARAIDRAEYHRLVSHSLELERKEADESARRQAQIFAAAMKEAK